MSFECHIIAVGNDAEGHDTIWQFTSFEESVPCKLLRSKNNISGFKDSSVNGLLNRNAAWGRISRP